MAECQSRTLTEWSRHGPDRSRPSSAIRRLLPKRLRHGSVGDTASRRCVSQTVLDQGREPTMQFFTLEARANCRLGEPRESEPSGKLRGQNKARHDVVMHAAVHHTVPNHEPIKPGSLSRISSGEGYFYQIEVPLSTEMPLRLELANPASGLVCDSTEMYDLQAWIELFLCWIGRATWLPVGLNSHHGIRKSFR